MEFKSNDLTKYLVKIQNYVTFIKKEINDLRRNIRRESISRFFLLLLSEDYFYWGLSQALINYSMKMMKCYPCKNIKLQFLSSLLFFFLDEMLNWFTARPWFIFFLIWKDCKSSCDNVILFIEFQCKKGFQSSFIEKYIARGCHLHH